MKIAAVILGTILSLWIALAIYCDPGWRRIENPNFPWNGPTSRAAKFQRTTHNFIHSTTEERWENADGEMVPYWPTFSDSIRWLRESEFMEDIIDQYNIDENSAQSPYHFYLVSIGPEVVIVSEQKNREFDYFNMFVIPTTDIPVSTRIFWFNPGLSKNVKQINLENGRGQFTAENARFIVALNNDMTLSVKRVKTQ